MLDQVLGNYWLSKIYEYRHVPKVVFGLGAVSKLGELAKGLGKNKSCIVITDKNLRKIGLIEVPMKSLQAAGFTVDIHEAEAKEPTIDEVNEIIGEVREGDYGLVVGIGGGAAMDKAKIAAVMAETPGKLDEYVCPSTKPVTGTKPKILLSTTSGTGSVCSNSAMVIVPHKVMGAIKSWIGHEVVQADASIIDPILTLGLPPRITAGSGMDALAHTAAATLSLQVDPFTEALSLKAVELISQNLRTAYHQGDNIEARWNMALAAEVLGGIVISVPWIAGTPLLDHVASEGISARYNIPHGEACGLFLPYLYWHNLPDAYARKKLAMIAKAMGEDVVGLDTKKAAEKAITATFNLLEDVGLPTSLKENGIPTKDIATISECIFSESEAMYSMSHYAPRKATPENIKEFFEKAFEGRESIGL